MSARPHTRGFELLIGYRGPMRRFEVEGPETPRMPVSTPEPPASAGGGDVASETRLRVAEEVPAGPPPLDPERARELAEYQRASIAEGLRTTRRNVARLKGR